jgi:diaminopimelate decarboxylase
MKANSNIEILKLMKKNGIEGIDAVSPGEIYIALKSGFKPEEILYTENNMSEEELDYALK